MANPPPATVGDMADYNKIFERLVDDSPDDEPAILGFVAYAYYKLAKREWVQNFCQQQNRKPSDAEMRAYISSWTDMRIDGLRTEANQSLSQFIEYVIDRERPKIVEQALKHRSFMRETMAACAGAALWTIVLIIFAFILKYFHIDALSVFQTVGH